MKLIFLPFSIILMLFANQFSFAQDTLMLENINHFNKKLDEINYRLKQSNNQLINKVDANLQKNDSFINLNMKQLDRIFNGIKLNAAAESNEIRLLEKKILDMHQKEMEINQWHTIIYAIMIVMIALLIVINLQTRKNTVNYLMSETNKLSDNQENIKEKANDLYELSIQISEGLVKQKKAIKKQEKSIHASQKTIIGKLIPKKSKNKKKK